VAYEDLGKYTFTTAKDYTGFNVGNLTSILDLSAIKVPNFELYRLLINTSAIPPPAGLPAVVQVSPFATGASATALNITFPKATTAGNLIVAGVMANSFAGNDPAPSGLTLGGSADNWAQVATAAAANPAPVYLWADPGTAETSAAIAVTMTGGTGGTYATAGMAWELSGMLATTSAAAAVDVSGIFASNTPTRTPVTASVATGTANDMLVGFGSALAGSTFGIAGPPAWASSVTGPSSGGGEFLGATGGVILAGAQGSPATYAPGSTGPAAWAAAAAAFLPSATKPAAAAFPFMVAVNGVTWDSEQTVAGVGYTYSLGQSPLYLRTGQDIQIFWDLAASAYEPYSQQFNITGWFRYDPAVQP
jgi:hypothetical protein